MNVEGTEARRIVFTDRGAEFRDYRLPALRPGEILVRSRCSLVSIGTETTLYVKRRWDAKRGPGTSDATASPSGPHGAPPAADEDQWDFTDYGSGESWDMDRNSRFPGYALAGDVIAVGTSAGEFSAGDRVVALHHHASFAIVPVHPSIVLRIPDGVSYEEATFCVLGSVSLHAVHRAGLRIGESALVMGAGLVGLLTVELARLAGATPLISVDLSPRRLELARRVGAEFTIDPTREDLVQRVREIVDGEGVSCAIEAVGNPAVLQSCMRVCAPGARVVVMGAIVGRVEIDLYSEFVFRELTLIASQQPRNPVQDSIYYHFTGQRNRRTLLEMIRRRSIDVAPLLTHRFSWREAPDVYRRLGAAKDADYDGHGDVNRDMVGVLFDWLE